MRETKTFEKIKYVSYTDTTTDTTMDEVVYGINGVVLTKDELIELFLAIQNDLIYGCISNVAAEASAQTKNRIKKAIDAL